MSVPKVILVGPFPPAFIDRLTAPLVASGAPFRLLNDMEKIEQYQEMRKREGLQVYPQFHSHDMVLLEVSREHVMLIRKEVENLGFSLKDAAFDPEFEQREYLCPKCDHHSLAQGLCPKHRIPLLEFSDWVAAQRGPGSMVKFLAFAVVLVVLGLAIHYSYASALTKPSQLPLALVGTIIRAEEAKSLATLMFTNSKATEVYGTYKLVGTYGEVRTIERQRVLILNRATNQLEFVALAAYDSSRAVKPGSLDGDGDKELQVRRSLVDETLKNLPAFLNQARAVAVTGPGGAVEGFKLETIQPGSLYEKLGLKQGDILRSVNGVALNSLQAAVEVFQQFKASSLIQLRLDRGGRGQSVTYLVR